MNVVVLSGRMGADAEIRHANGKTVAQWRMALDGVQREAAAQWVSVVAWEKTAEFVRDYLGKGRRVCVEGRLNVREWDDKQTGQKRTAYEIVASKVDFMDSAPQGRQDPAPERPSRPAPAAPQGNFDDQVPF